MTYTGRFPVLEELAALLIIGEYMDELDPELPPEKEWEHWQSTTNFEHDHRRVRALMKDVWNPSNDRNAGMVKEALPKIQQRFEEFVRRLNTHTKREDRKLKRRHRLL